MVTIKLNLGMRRSIIPPMGSIPPTAGLHRSAVSARPLRVGRRTTPSVKPTQPSSILNKPNSLPLLENLLAWGETEKQKVIDMLKLLTPEFEEYDELVGQLDKLEHTLETTRQQIARLKMGQKPQ